MPGPVGPYGYGVYLVAPSVDGPQHRCRRDPGDVVFGGLASEEDDEADRRFIGHGAAVYVPADATDDRRDGSPTLRWTGVPSSSMRFSTEEIAAAVGGTLHGPTVEIERVTIDSREARPGDLFVPIVAERDGHR